MKTFLLSFLVSLPLMAAVEIGKPAPNFTLNDTAGKKVTLASQKGKWVVLEWFNKDCPFVHKHYESKNMQTLQDVYTGKGVAWFAIISSAKGRQGFLTPKEGAKLMKDSGMKATHLLFDTTGKVGKEYGAKTTPHMYIINPAGNLAYMGAIDDKDDTKIDSIATAKNYVKLALDAALAGQPIQTASTVPYGCSVKYMN